MLKKNEKVSVIIPVYNSEKFLAESIESVLNQTYKETEVIAVNDGSTDNSLEILERYSDKITIISQENQGLASALNVGIKQMSGKWFKWFSPDDVLKPGTIEKLVDVAKKIRSENTIVYSNWEIIDENGKKLRDFYESNYNKLSVFDFNVRLLDGQQINVNTTLIPVSLLNKGCMIEKVNDPVVIDYSFFLRAGILYNAKFYLISEPLIKYRTHSKQLSHKSMTKSIEYLSIIKNKILLHLESTQKKKYLDAMVKYQQKKPLTKKSLKLGLKLGTLILPNMYIDKILVFYLNKIRSNRN